jgi:hypothetical protein
MKNTLLSRDPHDLGTDSKVFGKDWQTFLNKWGSSQ